MTWHVKLQQPTLSTSHPPPGSPLSFLLEKKKKTHGATDLASSAPCTTTNQSINSRDCSSFHIPAVQRLDKAPSMWYLGMCRIIFPTSDEDSSNFRKWTGGDGAGLTYNPKVERPQRIRRNEHLGRSHIPAMSSVGRYGVSRCVGYYIHV